MERNRTLRATCIAASVLGAACTPVAWMGAPAPAVTPVQSVRHGAPDDEALYAMGRYHQSRGRDREAASAYERLLRHSPGHAEARNALGVLHASRGRFDLALAEFAAAAALAPNAAHIRSNLGLALLRLGRAEEAVSAVEQALALSPASTRAAENLGEARQRLSAVAGAVARPAAQEPSPSHTPASGAGPRPAASPPGAESAEPREARLPVPSLTLAAAGPGVYELRWTRAPVTRTTRPADRDGSAPSEAAPGAMPGQVAEGTGTPSATTRPPASVRLEISNGNGRRGFARQTAGYLRGAGYATARINDQRPFGKSTTHIQFRPGFEREARALSVRLAGPPPVVEEHGLANGTDVRVFIGRGAAPETLLVASGDDAWKSGPLALQVEPRLYAPSAAGERRPANSGR